MCFFIDSAAISNDKHASASKSLRTDRTRPPDIFPRHCFLDHLILLSFHVYHTAYKIVSHRDLQISIPQALLSRKHLLVARQPSDEWNNESAPIACQPPTNWLRPLDVGEFSQTAVVVSFFRVLLRLCVKTRVILPSAEDVLGFSPILLPPARVLLHTFWIPDNTSAGLRALVSQLIVVFVLVQHAGLVRPKTRVVRRFGESVSQCCFGLQIADCGRAFSHRQTFCMPTIDVNFTCTSSALKLFIFSPGSRSFIRPPPPRSRLLQLKFSSAMQNG